MDEIPPGGEELPRKRRERPDPTILVPRLPEGPVGLQEYWEHMAARGDERLSRAFETAAANGWQLVVKHRAGSVEAAVARIRRRNLYVRFAILGVLAVSLVALMIGVRRAHRLARQQMEFVAGISHELRTPVTAICSLSENLADGVVQPTDNIRKYGRMILDQGRRLGTLVEQTLEFAGISSGQNTHRLEPVAVRAGV